MDNDVETESFLSGRKIAFAGKLGGMTRREAIQLARRCAGTPVAVDDSDVDLIVIGADELPLDEDVLLEPSVREAAAQGQLEIISETELWQRLGLVDEFADRDIRRLYTPAMLADLLGVPVTVIRRWHRRGLIVPAREVNRLPYFDFQEVSTARHLAQLVSSGASPAAIERKLEQLSRFLPEADRPMTQLGVIIEGRDILLRQGEGLIEPGGQLRIDFDTQEKFCDSPTTEAGSPAVLSFEDFVGQIATAEELLKCAAAAEERGELAIATSLYRAALAAEGPRPEICFQLAEVLYLQGNIEAALERYYMAVELDENYVEARANLGCVLAESGDLELALAAFRGTLLSHHDYPDVHYHLARTLDELGDRDEAESHWRIFRDLAPDSPWAEEASRRLNCSD